KAAVHLAPIQDRGGDVARQRGLGPIDAARQCEIRKHHKPESRYYASPILLWFTTRNPLARPADRRRSASSQRSPRARPELLTERSSCPSCPACPRSFSRSCSRRAWSSSLRRRP